jgi:hypothetical protein
VKRSTSNCTTPPVGEGLYLLGSPALIDADGTTTTGPGTQGAGGLQLKATVTGDGLCTNSVTVPTTLFKRTGTSTGCGTGVTTATLAVVDQASLIDADAATDPYGAGPLPASVVTTIRQVVTTDHLCWNTQPEGLRKVHYYGTTGSCAAPGTGATILRGGSALGVTTAVNNIGWYYADTDGNGAYTVGEPIFNLGATAVTSQFGYRDTVVANGAYDMGEEVYVLATAPTHLVVATDNWAFVDVGAPGNGAYDDGEYLLIDSVPLGQFNTEFLCADWPAAPHFIRMDADGDCRTIDGATLVGQWPMPTVPVMPAGQSVNSYFTYYDANGNGFFDPGLDVLYLYSVAQAKTLYLPPNAFVKDIYAAWWGVSPSNPDNFLQHRQAVTSAQSALAPTLWLPSGTINISSSSGGVGQGRMSNVDAEITIRGAPGTQWPTHLIDNGVNNGATYNWYEVNGGANITLQDVWLTGPSNGLAGAGVYMVASPGDLTLRHVKIEGFGNAAKNQQEGCDSLPDGWAGASRTTVEYSDISTTSTASSGSPTAPTGGSVGLLIGCGHHVINWNYFHDTGLPSQSAYPIYDHWPLRSAIFEGNVFEGNHSIRGGISLVEPCKKLGVTGVTSTSTGASPCYDTEVSIRILGNTVLDAKDNCYMVKAPQETTSPPGGSDSTTSRVGIQILGNSCVGTNGFGFAVGGQGAIIADNFVSLAPEATTGYCFDLLYGANMRVAHNTCRYEGTGTLVGFSTYSAYAQETGASYVDGLLLEGNSVEVLNSLQANTKAFDLAGISHVTLSHNRGRIGAGQFVKYYSPLMTSLAPDASPSSYLYLDHNECTVANNGEVCVQVDTNVDPNARIFSDHNKWLGTGGKSWLITTVGGVHSESDYDEVGPTVATGGTIDGTLPSCVQTVTVAAGAGAPAFTVTPTCAVVQIVCNDTDGCTGAMGKTWALNGVPIAGTVQLKGAAVLLEATTANVVTFPDSPGTLELAGPTPGTAWAGAANDHLSLRYTGAAWAEVSRADN